MHSSSIFSTQSRHTSACGGGRGLPSGSSTVAAVAVRCGTRLALLYCRPSVGQQRQRQRRGRSDRQHSSAARIGWRGDGLVRFGLGGSREGQGRACERTTTEETEHGTRVVETFSKPALHSTCVETNKQRDDNQTHRLMVYSSDDPSRSLLVYEF